MSSARKQSPFSRCREHDAHIVRSRSQSGVVDCEAARLQERVKGSMRDCVGQPARGDSRADSADHFQLHEVSCTNRRPLASRILTAGLLPHLQLRCSLCQGSERLAQQQSSLHRLRCSLTTASCSDLEYKNVPLHGAAHLSHLVSDLFSHPADRTGRPTWNGVPFACTDRKAGLSSRG
jgi:hypothetical protein